MDVPQHFHFTHRRTVEFADTDLAGIVHFANFFRYVESAEHAFFRSLGFPAHRAEGTEHHGWPRLDVSCQFHQPARFEQTVEIGLRIEEIRTSSLRYGFWVFAVEDSKRSLLAHGGFTIIHVAFEPPARELRKTPIPAALRARLDSLLTAIPPTS